MNAAVPLACDEPTFAGSGARRYLDLDALLEASRRCPYAVDSMASPGLADAWAQAIVFGWETQHVCTPMDRHQPLFVLDLEPGRGQFARLLLSALRERLARSPLSSCELRYMACASSHPGDDPWLVHGELADDERFDVLLGDPTDLSALLAPGKLKGYCCTHMCNPLAVVALGYLQHLAGSLRGVHYGRWMEGRPFLAAEDDTGYALEYAWAQSFGAAPSPEHELLRQRYLRSLSCAYVRVPDAALKVLDNVARLSHGKFLWLAADSGVVAERQIRTGMLAPPVHWSSASEGLPVNFHALAYAQARHGAWCCHWQHGDAGIVVQAIWRHADMELKETCVDRLAEYLDAYHPEDTRHDLELASVMGPDAPASSWLRLLRASHYDARVLGSILLHWSEAPPALSDIERDSWAHALARAWNSCPRFAEAAEWRHGMALFAAQLGSLNLAKAIFDSDGHRVGIAWCEALGGRSAGALERLRGLHLVESGEQSLREELAARQAAWQSLAWYAPHAASDGELTLEPLCDIHANDLLDQYRDPEIAVMTRLPAIESLDVARAWIAEQGLDRRHACYAVMHADHGFVGVVSLYASGDSAYFYFWIGSDYQGRGYGRRAGRLAQAQARAGGMARLYTSVYPENLRSVQALQSLGFVSVDILALPPDEELLFLTCPLQPGFANDARAGLVALCRDLDSSMCFAADDTLDACVR